MCQPIAPSRVKSSSMNRQPGATRRSVYLQQRRTQITSLLEVFDAPSIVTTCTRRVPSTIPLQSLSLMNSDFVIARAQRARHAARASVQCGNAGKCPDCDARISQAFLVAIGREPGPEERTAARRFLETQPSRYPRLG